MSMFRKTVSSLALLSVLTGCASTQSALQVDETLRVAERLRSVSERPAAPADMSQVQIRPSAYVGAEVRRNDKGDPFPSKWQAENVKIARAAPATFQDIANAITRTTGIPVALDTGGAGGAVSAPVQTASLAQGGDLGNAIAAVQGIQAPVLSPVDFGVPGSMTLSYDGKLSGLLDLVSANFNVAWTHEAGQIVFSRYVTRAFDVPALPIISSLKFDLSSGGSSSGASGGATSEAGQKASTEGGFNIWSDLEKTMAAIVGSSGTFQMSPQTAQIVVVAPPPVVRRVETYLKDVNQTLSKQVAVSVKVFSVKVNDRNEAESDLRVMLREAGRYGLSLYVPQNLAFDSVAGASGSGWAVVGGNGSTEDVLFKLLSDRGDASVVTSASVTSLNGVPVPVQVARTRGYLAAVENTTTGGDGVASTSLTPGSVTTGFNLHLVPRVLRNGDLLMQYGINISELVGPNGGFNTFSSGGQTIQLPDVTQRNFIQQAQVPNGKTLVLAGFEQVSTSNRQRGPLSPALWPLGGSSAAGSEREVIVIAITPTVLDINAPMRTASPVAAVQQR